MESIDWMNEAVNFNALIDAVLPATARNTIAVAANTVVDIAITYSFGSQTLTYGSHYCSYSGY